MAQEVSVLSKKDMSWLQSSEMKCFHVVKVVHCVLVNKGYEIKTSIRNCRLQQFVNALKALLLSKEGKHIDQMDCQQPPKMTVASQAEGRRTIGRLR